MLTGSESAREGGRRGPFVAALAGIAPFLFFLALGWAGYRHWSAEIAPFDDAYITFRYVDNLAAGDGMVYNRGERVLGSTTPLYLLLLALVKIAFPYTATPLLAVHFNFLTFTAAGFGAWLLLRRLTGNALLSAAGGAAVLADPLFVSWSLGGMESYLFASLLLFGALAAANRRGAAFGALVGLACLTRPEGVLLAPVGAVLLVGRWRAALRAAAAFAAVVAPWCLFAWAYFGSPVPLSVIAKAKPLYPVPPGFALERLAAQFADWFTLGRMADPGRAASILVVCVVPVLTAAALASAEFRRRAAWIPGALFSLFVLFYAVTNPLVFPWYLPPVHLFALIALLTATAAFGKRRWAGAVRAGIAAVVLVLSAIRVAAMPDPSLLLLEKPGHMRIREYRKAAEIVNALARPGDRVAAPEIGSFGYYYAGTVLDACGLVSPEAHPFLPVPDEERLRPGQGVISREFVRATEPEFVVTMQVFAARSIARSLWFRQHYRLIDAVPFAAPVWGSPSVQIFGRRDAAGPEGDGTEAGAPG